MPLSWNEINRRAITFSREHKDDTSEAGERQTFWNEFFEIFGKRRRALASFEEPVKKLSGNWGHIDLFWPGQCLVEHKSAGQNLGKARAQGMEYIRGLQEESRDEELPRYLIVSDFKRIAIHDLEPEQDPDLPLFTRIPPSVEFELKDLHKYIRHFAFIAGYKTHKLDPEDPANFDATELMADIHDALYDGGYPPKDLCQFLVRILFCLFAEDTGLFLQDHLKLYLLDHTAEDGSDLGSKLQRIFHILDTPEDQRQANLDEDLAQFPYVNGDLFKDRLDFADFNREMRDTLLAACNFHWDKISPGIFGSLFQTVFDHQDDRLRRQLGAHYTNEQNIMKIVRCLFLDDLRAEFESAKKDRSGRGAGRLKNLQDHLASLTFLDPACGCGNFLVITYRELRHLELEILLELHKNELDEVQTRFGEEQIYALSKIDVDQMFGIEIEEFPAKIAEVALWLTDHQANLLLSEAFGQFYRRIPLRNSPHIHHANALQTDWRTILPPDQCSYVLGNPPFVGKKEQSSMQKTDHARVWNGVSNFKTLDFVCCWHLLASRYMQGTNILASFVSTNSICQGEQVGILWPHLQQHYSIQRHFAHRTFQWESEARGKAHVHCIIIGFSANAPEKKTIYEYENEKGIPTAINVSNISPYLIEGTNLVLTSRSSPLFNGAPHINKGSELTDFGNFIITNEEKTQIVKESPVLSNYIKHLTGGREFIHSNYREVLYLKNAQPAAILASATVRNRLEDIRRKRRESDKERTRSLAEFPTLFGEDRQPTSNYLIIPKVSSQSRNYIPIGFLNPDIIVNGSAQIISNASVYEFGIITSQIHMDWMRLVCGRTKSDYQYSIRIVYNNFPWPTPTEKQKAAIEAAAQGVLDARDNHPTATLADLYNPVGMPPDLTKAHQKLDKAVDRAYRRGLFPNDRTRVEFLFALYEQLTAPLAQH